MMQGGVDISLPKAEAKPLESKSGLVVSVNRAGEIRIDDEKFSFAEFRVAFKSIAATRAHRGVYLRADQGVPYGTIVRLIAIMNNAGVTQVGLVTEPEEIK
jgi:biopolymer transport protein ExbD